MKVIDYVEYNGWGHAVHSLREVKPEKFLTRLLDRLKKQYRGKMLVHCMSSPEKGDIVRYKTIDGVREAEVYDVEQFNNPKDMFNLFLVFKKKRGNE